MPKKLLKAFSFLVFLMLFSVATFTGYSIIRNIESRAQGGSNPTLVSFPGTNFTAGAQGGSAWSNISGDAFISGKLGVGVTSSANKMQVTSTTETSLGLSRTDGPNIQFEDVGQASLGQIQYDTSRKMHFSTPGDPQDTLTLDLANRRVGIGSMTPTVPLEVKFDSAAAAATGAKVINSNTTAGAGGALEVLRYDGVNYLGGKIYGTTDGGGWPDGRMTLASQGVGTGTFIDTLSLKNARVGIGLNNPLTKFHIKQVSDTWGGGLRLERTAGNWSEIVTGSDNHLYFGINGVAVWCSMTTSATVGCSSDRRVKKNIELITESGLDIISKLKPSTFDFTKSDGHGAGFIAQEVLEVLPGAVSKNATDGYYSLSDSYFTPYLVKGVQELDGRTKKMQDQIDSLTSQVKSQKSDIELLKNEIETLKANVKK